VASNRITVCISKTLQARIRDRSRTRGQTASDVVRSALRDYLGRRDSFYSAYELAREAGLIGCVRHASKGLSTNRRHFEGFGKHN
jgi:hypothetical protein